MIELFIPESMRKVDARLINEFGIPGVDLMERAASGVAERVREICKTRPSSSVFILCGPGNNGGDGFAVAAMLHEDDIPVYTVILADAQKYAGDAKYEYERAKACDCAFIPEESYLGRLSANAIVVDAVFGTGLCREVSPDMCALITETNASGVYIISVDIPSGLNGKTGEVMGAAFCANETVTFHRYKLGLLTENGRMHTGTVTVHPIADVDPDEKPDAFCTEQPDIARLLPERQLNSHKGKNGRALILGGCAKYKGAVKLCTAAALRGGCGLLSVAVPGAVVPALYDLPEAMCVSLNEGAGWDAACCSAGEKLIAGRNAVAIGPGMGEAASSGLFETLLASEIPAVIDADGLNHISSHRELIPKLHKKIVLTPHPVELSRLLGCKADDILKDPAGFALRAANELNAVVVLKGATSYISDGNALYLNITGNPGLAKGGSGDTLTGLILAMLSQGLSPLDAACTGTYLLGASADNAIKLLGTRMLLARDVIGIVGDTADGIRLS